MEKLFANINIETFVAGEGSYYFELYTEPTYENGKKWYLTTVSKWDGNTLDARQIGHRDLWLSEEAKKAVVTWCSEIQLAALYELPNNHRVQNIIRKVTFEIA